VQTVSTELQQLLEPGSNQAPNLLVSHSFVVDDDDIQPEQIRRIVRPIGEKLQTQFDQAILHQGITRLKEQITSGYAPKNLALLETLIAQ
jgi:hypothetical protein